MVGPTRGLDSSLPRSAPQNHALAAHSKGGCAHRLTVATEVVCAPLHSTLGLSSGHPGCRLMLWPWQCVSFSSGGELEGPAWPFHRVGVQDVLVCNLQVDGEDKNTGKCVWVGCKVRPCAKQSHCKGDMCTSSSGPAGDGECFLRRRSRHQLGIPGRQMHCDGRVTPPTAIVHYLSEPWFI